MRVQRFVTSAGDCTGNHSSDAIVRPPDSYVADFARARLQRVGLAGDVLDGLLARLDEVEDLRQPTALEDEHHV